MHSVTLSLSIFRCSVSNGEFLWLFCRPTRARSQRVPDSWLRECWAPLHAALETGKQQHGRLAVALVHSLSMSKARQVGALLDHGDQTESSVGRGIQVRVGRELSLNARKLTKPNSQQLGKCVQGTRTAARGTRELPSCRAPKARLHRRVH